MKRQDLIQRLERFLDLARQHAAVYRQSHLQVSDQIRAVQEDQEAALNRMFGGLEPFILKVSTARLVTIQGLRVNPWRCAFIPGPQVIKGQCLDLVIGDLGRIIGHYEALAQEEVEVENVNLLFDSLKLHPRVIKASERLFKDRHYAQAIFDAVKEVNAAVQEASGVRDRDFTRLMQHVFSEQNPKIRLTNLSTPVEIDEHVGFGLLFQGLMRGIRNPKAHAVVKQDDPYRTLAYLSLASLLLQRLDERVLSP